MIAPPQGKGLHNWLLYHSRDLLVKGYSTEEASKILLDASRNSERTTQDLEGEISNALEGAREFLEENPGFVSKGLGGSKKLAWKDLLDFAGLDDGMVRRDRRKASVPANLDLIQEVLDTEGEYYTLDKGDEVGGFAFVDLFSGLDFNICACVEMFNSTILPLNQWQPQKNFLKMQYIVPNYFWKNSMEEGTRSDFNIGERLFVVVEFDAFDKDKQCLLLNYMARKYKQFPLVMIVDSGSKSLHGWFSCFGYSEYKVKTFCRKATELGADKTTSSPSQFVRMPNGWNCKQGVRQDVIYFDVNALFIHSALVREEMLGDEE